MSPFKKYNETGGICWVGGEPKIYNFYQIFDNKGMVKRKKTHTQYSNWIRDG